MLILPQFLAALVAAMVIVAAIYSLVCQAVDYVRAQSRRLP